jgi:hypothetical protein
MVRYFLIVIYAFIMSCETFESKPIQLKNKNMQRMIGKWDISATDRTEPGKYENNNGQLEILPLIDSSGVSIQYNGKFKNKPLLVLAWLVEMSDSLIIKTNFDSNHGNAMKLEGQYTLDTLKLFWKREFPNRTMIVKHQYVQMDSMNLKYESFLSPNSGKEWHLTHQWTASRRTN